MVVRRGPPAAIVSRLAQDVISALRQPDVAERAAALGLDLVGTGPDEFGAFMRAEMAKWSEVIRTAKIQVE
jgi:tripartite-type tricarboxylate transporter receptor subunit TctC